MDCLSQLLFLGTGAADWDPAAQGPGHRAYSSLLVDGHILIDCTLSALDALGRKKINLQDITDVLITHTHDDHYQPEALRQLAGAAAEAGRPPIKIHMHRAAARAAMMTPSTAVYVPHAAGAAFHLANYSILPLEANHPGTLPREKALHYLFSRDQRHWLYATDGAWILYPSWQAIRTHPLSGLVIDCTIGAGHAGDYRIFEHNSLPMVRLMVDTFVKQQILKPGAPVVLTHLARTLHPGRAELDRQLEKPFIAAFDGYETAIR
ncbi:MAG: MBL fold metallo-hydrolase [Clostridiaceae bacterium]|nr:MBL fold metallo-hydrolase [Clostridiaceae bacterium]